MLVISKPDVMAQGVEHFLVPGFSQKSVVGGCLKSPSNPPSPTPNVDIPPHARGTGLR